jgi:hypothetical protein
MGLGFFGSRDLGAGLLLLRGRRLSEVSSPPGVMQGAFGFGGDILRRRRVMC